MLASNALDTAIAVEIACPHNLNRIGLKGRV